MKAWPGQFIVKTQQGDVPVKVRHSPRAKRLRLNSTEFGIILTVPPRAKQKVAENFIKSSTDWIDEAVRQMKVLKSLFDYANIRFEGKKLPIVQSDGPLAKKVEFQPHQILADAPTPLLRRKLVEAALRRMARKVLAARTEHFSQIMGVKPTKIRIADQRTRWGSCSTLGTISYNWRLIMTPPDVLDYIVIHELAHLKHMDHSPEFWDFVKLHRPNYREQEQWLDEIGPALVRRSSEIDV